jgi:hypothetical protein
MTIRSDAIKWLAARGVTGGHVVTSKLYGPDESWTKEKAWWIPVPLSAIQAGKTIHIVCEAADPGRRFHHLQVPAAFFEQRLRDFAGIGDDKINLFLAAEPGMEFQDQRGPGKVSLARFEVGALKVDPSLPSG